MGAAIGQSLPLAVGVLVSPIPIVAVALMLVSARARVTAPAFVVGWILAVAIVTLAAAWLTGGAAADGDDPAVWTGWLRIVLGALLLLVAVRQWRSRPRGDSAPSVPGWMRAIDRFTAVRAAGLGALLSAVNPKNLLLVIAGGAAIGSAGHGPSDLVVAAAVFTLVASSTVVAPVVVYLAMGDRAAEPLDRLKTWLVRENAVIMAILLLVIGAKLIGDGIAVV